MGVTAANNTQKANNTQPATDHKPPTTAIAARALPPQRHTRRPPTPKPSTNHQPRTTAIAARALPPQRHPRRPQHHHHQLNFTNHQPLPSPPGHCHHNDTHDDHQHHHRQLSFTNQLSTISDHQRLPSQHKHCSGSHLSWARLNHAWVIKQRREI
jgi:hypothetical protein